jgi:hypothetical protein
MAGKKIDEMTKQKVREAHAEGLSGNKIAEQFGISPRSVGRIVKEVGLPNEIKKDPGAKGGPDRQKRIEDLEKRISRLEEKILELEARRSSGRSSGCSK